jgi:hypothetical protein
MDIANFGDTIIIRHSPIPAVILRITLGHGDSALIYRHQLLHQPQLPRCRVDYGGITVTGITVTGDYGDRDYGDRCVNP